MAPTPAGFTALPVPLAQLSLAAVLKCGQSFRWSIFPLIYSDHTGTDPHRPTHEYRLCLRDRVVCLRQSPDFIFYRAEFPTEPPSDHKAAETLAWIRDYFQLDIDLVALYTQWSSSDPVFHRLRDRFEGIRMLRQDPFENLISFICSSNNNISRITKMVKSLCTNYSPPLLTLPPPPEAAQTPPEPYHPFPCPSALADSAVATRLRELGFGYRAGFIQRTAAMLVGTHGKTFTQGCLMEPAEEWLHTLRNMSTPEARTELLKFVGVGRKVADCILLMSLDKREVIPVDTHVHQIAVKHYGLRSGPKGGAMTPRLYEEVNTKLAAIWGEYAGWAHSVLFTSDLKSFSSYGLPSTPATPSMTPDRGSILSDDSPPIATPTGLLPLSPPTPNKRKRSQTQEKPQAGRPTEPTTKAAALLDVIDSEGLSLADRVKRRRRMVEVPTALPTL